MENNLVVLEISDVADLLGATRFTLERVIRRAKIRPSVARKKWKRMVFTPSDLGKLGLAYWLHRSGLHNKAIQDVVEHRNIAGRLSNLIPALKENEECPKYLVTWRIAGPKPQKGERQQFRQEVFLAGDWIEAGHRVEDGKQFGYLVVPLGQRVQELSKGFRNFVNSLQEETNSVNL